MARVRSVRHPRFFRGVKDAVAQVPGPLFRVSYYFITIGGYCIFPFSFVTRILSSIPETLHISMSAYQHYISAITCQLQQTFLSMLLSPSTSSVRRKVYYTARLLWLPVSASM